MITVNLYYKGAHGSARAFAKEMEESGIADSIRKEPGNLRYQYFQPLNDQENILLREKYDLHMTAERFVSENIGTDEQFIRK